jgi:hypothetical protein
MNSGTSDYALQFSGILVAQLGLVRFTVKWPFKSHRKRFHAEGWRIELASKWLDEPQENVASFFRADGVGALQISSYEAPSELTDEELLHDARTGVPQDTPPRPVICGHFSGFMAEYLESEAFWRKWWLRSGTTLVSLPTTRLPKHATSKTTRWTRCCEPCAMKRPHWRCGKSRASLCSIACILAIHGWSICLNKSFIRTWRRIGVVHPPMLTGVTLVSIRHSQTRPIFSDRRNCSWIGENASGLTERRLAWHSLFSP